MNCHSAFITKKKGKEKGFTLLEVIIAITILTVGLLALASMQVSAIKGNTLALGFTEATSWTSDRIEKLMILPYDHAHLVDTDGDGVGNRLDEDDDNDGVMDVLESGKESTDARTASGLPLLNGDTLTIVTAPGESLTQVASSKIQAIHGRSGINLMFGMVSYTTSSEIGGTVAVRLTLSRQLPSDLIIYKQTDEGDLYQLPSTLWRQVGARTIEVILTDGDPMTDSDNSVNGSIADPLILGIAPTSVAGGGGGGCTINAKASVDPVWLLLLAAYLRMYFVRNGFYRKKEL